MTTLFNKAVSPAALIKDLLALPAGDFLPAIAILAVTDDGQRIPEEGHRRISPKR